MTVSGFFLPAVPAPRQRTRRKAFHKARYILRRRMPIKRTAEGVATDAGHTDHTARRDAARRESHRSPAYAELANRL
ncbi:hypothetical protein F01_190103 [Burkholderia cenocepacia]|nr:hypothetical protein F01_190103 [Burkholderia cenocepacia]